MADTAAFHPTDPTLRAYGLGKLDDVSWESVSNHLEACDSCQRRVAELSSDDFLGRLQQAGFKPDKATSGWSPSVASSIESKASAFVPPPSAETLPPELVDHPDWEIMRELGRGGMGVVYLADNKLMGRQEVLKVVGRHLIERPGVLDRFTREIQSAARLQHPNIVTAYSAMRVGSSLVLSMEYVKGYDLAKIVKARGPLPIALASHFIHQAALGLQHAHERGMVHRDIKPANLMVGEGKKAVVKVLDFGLAKVTSEGETDSNLTREGQMVGTPDYIAPEQIRDAKSADIRADIYSLGCTLYYLLSGGPPFRGEHLWDIYQAHFSMDAGPLNLIRPEVPVELAAVVAKMMAKEPGRRFQTPGEVARALVPFFKPAQAQPAVGDGEARETPRPIAPGQNSRAGQPPGEPATASIPGEPPLRRSQPPAAQPSTEKEARSAGPRADWGSLIELEEAEPLTPKALPAIKRGPRGPTRYWPATAAGALLLAVIALCAALVLRVDTPHGTIVLENVPDDAVVEVDGKKINVTLTEGEPFVFEATAGTHGLVVRRGDLMLLVTSVTIEAGRKFKQQITARLEPPVGKQPEKTESTATIPPAPAIVPLPADRSRFTVVGGAWDRQGDELSQGDASQWFSDLSFGDDQWTDYDFTVDAMRVAGTGSCSLAFRRTNWGNELEYAVAEEQNKACHLLARKQGAVNTIQRHDFSLQNQVWYTARVRARGNRMVCTLYDSSNATETMVFNCSDESHARGRVGLKTFGSAFRFKNIKVTSPDGRLLWEGAPAVPALAPSVVSSPALESKRPVAATAGFVPLFNGKDKAGWKLRPGHRDHWKVENGVLIGSGAGDSHLCSERGDYKDFHLRVEARVSRRGNSGIFFRAPFRGFWDTAYEAEIGGRTGALIVYRGPVPQFREPRLPAGAWFTLDVIADGNRLLTKVDGKVAAEFLDEKPRFPVGHIILEQCDAGTVVEFRKIEIRELNFKGQETRIGSRDE